MTGPYESVIGMDKEVALKKLRQRLPEKFAVAQGDPRFCAVLIDINEQTGKATSIERVEKKIES